SCITSAVNVPGPEVEPVDATVRQQPFTEIESPSPASLVTSGPRTVSRIASPWSSSDSTLPSSSTMPVNISLSPGGFEGQSQVVAEAGGVQHAQVEGLVDAAHAEVAHRMGTRSQQLGRDVGDHLVDQA